MYLHGRGVWGRMRLHYNKKTFIFFYRSTSWERGVFVKHKRAMRVSPQRGVFVKHTERLHRDTSWERGVGGGHLTHTPS